MCNLFNYLPHTDCIRVADPARTSIGAPATVEVTMTETVTVYPSGAVPSDKVTDTTIKYVQLIRAFAIY
jgi:hypothetical protein